MAGANIKDRSARDLSSVTLLPLWTMLNTLVLLANQATFLPWSSRAKADSAKSVVLSSLQVELLELSAGHQVWWKILWSFMLTNHEKRWHAGRLCPRSRWCTNLIMLYMYIVSQWGYWKVMIRTIDTNVVVLAVSKTQVIDVDELWIAFGTGKYFRYLAIRHFCSA